VRREDAKLGSGAFTGLLITLFASVPALVFNLICVFSPMVLDLDGNIISSLSYVSFLLIKLLFSGTFVGVIQSVLPTELEPLNVLAQPPYYLLTLLPAILAGFGGYLWGLKDRKLSELFFGWMRNQEDDKE